MSGPVSDPLGRPPRFKPRPHKLGGLGLDERKLTAIGGDEQIVTRAIRIGGGACAIRLDGIRAGDVLVVNSILLPRRGILRSSDTGASPKFSRPRRILRRGVRCQGVFTL